MTAEHKPAKAAPVGASRRWKVAFALSLALNLAVLGVVGGAMLRHGGPGGSPSMNADFGFGPLAEAFEDDDRRDLRRAFQANRPDVRQIRQERRADAKRLLAALRAEPFDAAAVQQVLAETSARTMERIATGQRLALERVALMTPAERAAFADRLEQVLSRGKDKDRDHGGKRDDDR